MINSHLEITHQQEGGALFPVESKESEVMGESEVKGAEQEEVRELRAPPIPMTPSREEVRQHRLKHHPYREWCPHCVKGKGREAYRFYTEGCVYGNPGISQ